MICKKNILKWFRDLSAYKRVDIMTSMLRMYVPLELHILKANIQMALGEGVEQVQQNELIANSIHELQKELSISSYGIFDVQIRHKLTSFVALVRPDNRNVGDWIFQNFLQTPCAWINGSMYIIGSTLDLLDELLLLFIVAHNHPAFKFCDKLELARTIARLEKEYSYLASARNQTYEMFFSETLAASKIDGKMVHDLNASNIKNIKQSEANLKCPPGLAFSNTPMESDKTGTETTDPKDSQQSAGSSSKDVSSTTEELQVPLSSFYQKSESFEELSSRTTIHPGHTPSPEPSGDSQIPDDFYDNLSTVDKPEYRNFPESKYDDRLASSSNKNVAETQRISNWVETGYSKTSADQFIDPVQRLRLDDTSSIAGGQSSRSNASNSSRAESHTVVYDSSGLDYTRSTETATVSATASLSDSETRTTAAQRVTFAETVASSPRGPRVQSYVPEQGSSNSRLNESTSSIPQTQSSQHQPHQQQFVPHQPHFMQQTFHQPSVYSQPMHTGSARQQPAVFTNAAGVTFMSSGSVPYQMIVYPSSLFPSINPNYQVQSNSTRSHFYINSLSGELLCTYSGLPHYYPTHYQNLVHGQQPSTPQRLQCWNCGTSSHSAGECDTSPVDHSSSSTGSGVAQQQRFRPIPASNTVPVTTSAPQSTQSPIPSTSVYVPPQSFSTQSYTSSNVSSQSSSKPKQ